MLQRQKYCDVNVVVFSENWRWPVCGSLWSLLSHEQISTINHTYTILPSSEVVQSITERKWERFSFYRSEPKSRNHESLWTLSDGELEILTLDKNEMFPPFCTKMLYMFNMMAARRILKVADMAPFIGSLEDVWITGYLARKVIEYN